MEAFAGPDDHLPAQRRAGMAVTSHDVARAAGVSQSTVSRVLRTPGRVSAPTREKVLTVATALGYVPSDVGRSLVTRATRTIAIVITDLTSAHDTHLIAPLHDELSARAYRMVLFTEPVEGHRERPDGAEPLTREEEVKPLIDRLLNRATDGVVLTTSRLDGIVPRVLTQHALPFVFLTRYTEGIAADWAIVDNSLGASLIAHEAIRLGHRRIGAIFGPADASTGRDRERGTRAALAAAGIELPDHRVRHGLFTFAAGYGAMTELMAEQPAPTVVLCANDTVAIGAFNAARALELRVPEDVSLAGFDDLPMADWEVFRLTTVHQPIEEMARTAVRLLIERIDGRAEAEAGRQMVFAPRLVVRDTLAPPPEES
ncbi:LacI family DNA-binding transcriptional regulator [Conexibacter sp. DBS9H8]|uniref:LacI family DNA-binding transcriptional regulator n=1 Tax=Conexibacter sp. DBS9H8 TaxID=2937801 RepID=UPI00200C980F|nr:LacI family DNA-binding transcriptional regulator [Conexibacter sp. DBS9H8]